MTLLFVFADPVPVSVPHKAADQIPPELKKLMQPLCCELCNIKSNSPISAKIHYDSKVHEKKVRHWLLEWSSRTGNPVPERAAVSFLYTHYYLFIILRLFSSLLPYLILGQFIVRSIALQGMRYCAEFAHTCKPTLHWPESSVVSTKPGFLSKFLVIE